MLPNILAKGLKLVVCGTAAGSRSAEMGTYYAGRGNKFWRTLHKTGLTPTLMQPSEQFDLLKHGIGLTDLVKGQAGMDSVITFTGDFRRLLQETVDRWDPAMICFNGKRAASEVLGISRPTFGLQSDCIGAARVFIAPSTSGAANATWDEQHWHILARLVFSVSRGT